MYASTGIVFAFLRFRIQNFIVVSVTGAALPVLEEFKPFNILQSQMP